MRESASFVVPVEHAARIHNLTNKSTEMALNHLQRRDGVESLAATAVEGPNKKKIEDDADIDDYDELVSPDDLLAQVESELYRVQGKLHMNFRSMGW